MKRVILCIYMFWPLSVLFAGDSYSKDGLYVNLRKPIDQQQLVGTWFGVAEDNLHYFLVDLNRDKRGRAGVVYNDDNPQEFIIKEWGVNLTNANFSAELEPGDSKSSEIFYIDGYYNGEDILATVCDSREKNNWCRKLRLFRYKSVFNKLRVIEAMLAGKGNPAKTVQD